MYVNERIFYAYPICFLYSESYEKCIGFSTMFFITNIDILEEIFVEKGVFLPEVQNTWVSLWLTVIWICIHVVDISVIT